MKAITTGALLMTLSLLSATTSLTSCQSSAPDQAARTGNNLSTLAKGLAVANDRVKSTLASLTALQASADADLRPTYDEYVKQVDSLSSASDRVESDYNTVTKGGKDYFKNWEEGIANLSNEEFQKRNRDRLDEAKKNYAKVEAGVAETNTKFDSLLSDLTDIKESLGFDLNKAGVGSISGIVDSCNSAGAELQKRFAKTIDMIREVEEAMSAGSAAPAAGEGAQG